MSLATIVGTVGCYPAWSGTGPPLALGLAFHLGRRGPLDAKVPATVVEQRHRVLALVGQVVHSTDEQVVITGRERLDDRAFEGRDRPVDERQAGPAPVPGGAAEPIATRFDRCAREAV